ncbi:UNVERIFIED_CONTAM: hypothetical protein FKN15_052476 [Acipenser sinensis]
MKDGTGCYDYAKGTDCSDGFNGGCEQLCLQQLVPLPEDLTSSNVLMFCGCVEEYRLAADGRSCVLLSDACEGPRCQRQDGRLNDTLFGEMLHGYNNKTQQVNQGQTFQMTFRMSQSQKKRSAELPLSPNKASKPVVAPNMSAMFGMFKEELICQLSAFEGKLDLKLQALRDEFVKMINTEISAVKKEIGAVKSDLSRY